MECDLALFAHSLTPPRTRRRCFFVARFFVREAFSQTNMGTANDRPTYVEPFLARVLRARPLPSFRHRPSATYGSAAPVHGCFRVFAAEFQRGSKV